jgi:ankyrin repeat protein
LAGNESLALSLIDSGASIDHTDTDGTDLLSHSIARSLVPTANLLLERDNGVWTQLHKYLISAASEGNLEIVTKLLNDKGCDVNGADGDNSNALMAACARGQSEVVSFLLQRENIDINAQNVDGHTALMFANNGVRISIYFALTFNC